MIWETNGRYFQRDENGTKRISAALYKELSAPTPNPEPAINSSALEGVTLPNGAIIQPLSQWVKGDSTYYPVLLREAPITLRGEKIGSIIERLSIQSQNMNFCLSILPPYAEERSFDIYGDQPTGILSEMLWTTLSSEGAEKELLAQANWAFREDLSAQEPAPELGLGLIPSPDQMMDAILDGHLKPTSHEGNLLWKLPSGAHLWEIREKGVLKGYAADSEASGYLEQLLGGNPFRRSAIRKLLVELEKADALAAKPSSEPQEVELEIDFEEEEEEEIPEWIAVRPSIPQIEETVDQMLSGKIKSFLNGLYDNEMQWEPLHNLFASPIITEERTDEDKLTGYHVSAYSYGNNFEVDDIEVPFSGDKRADLISLLSKVYLYEEFPEEPQEEPQKKEISSEIYDALDNLGAASIPENNYSLREICVLTQRLNNLLGL